MVNRGRVTMMMLFVVVGFNWLFMHVMRLNFGLQEIRKKQEKLEKMVYWAVFLYMLCTPPLGILTVCLYIFVLTFYRNISEYAV